MFNDKELDIDISNLFEKYAKIHNTWRNWNHNSLEKLHLAMMLMPPVKKILDKRSLVNQMLSMTPLLVIIENVRHLIQKI